MKRKADIDLIDAQTPLKKSKNVAYLMTRVWVHYHGPQERYPAYYLSFWEPHQFGQSSDGKATLLDKLCSCACSRIDSVPCWTSIRIPMIDTCWLTHYEPQDFKRASENHLTECFRGSAGVTNLVLQYVGSTDSTKIMIAKNMANVKDFEIKLCPANLYENNPEKFWPRGIPIKIEFIWMNHPTEYHATDKYAFPRDTIAQIKKDFSCHPDITIPRHYAVEAFYCFDGNANIRKGTQSSVLSESLMLMDVCDGRWCRFHVELIKKQTN